jgi:hypothetical protein
VRASRTSSTSPVLTTPLRTDTSCDFNIGATTFSVHTPRSKKRLRHPMIKFHEVTERSVPRGTDDFDPAPERPRRQLEPNSGNAFEAAPAAGTASR